MTTETIEKPRKKSRRARRKSAFAKEFQKGRKRYPEPEVIRFSRDELETVGINLRLGQNGHRAIEEIRRALQLGGMKPVCGADYNRIPKGAGEWTDSQSALWQRFKTWAWIMSLSPVLLKQRDAAIFFAKGFRPREIEREVKIRNGTALERIESGAREYCEMAGWVPISTG